MLRAMMDVHPAPDFQTSGFRPAAFPRRPVRRPRSLSVAMLTAGALTLAGCSLLYHRDLPRQLAGYGQTLVVRDAGGLAQVQRLTERSIAVRSGGFAVYGRGVASVWAASAADTAASRAWVDAVSARIAAGDTPFRADSTRRIGEREVRVYTGVGQRHFSFRSGSRVVWLAANAGLAEEALREALNFYQ